MRATQRWRPINPSTAVTTAVSAVSVGHSAQLVVAICLIASTACFSRQSPSPPDPDTTQMEAPVATAIRDARVAVTTAPQAAATWGHLGMVLHAHDLIDEAVPSYGEAQALAPQEFAWPYLLAHALEDKDPPLALASIDRAIEIDANYWQAYFLKGRLLEALGQTDDAVVTYQRAIDIRPRNAPASYSLGRLMLVKGELDLAKEHLEKAARLQPDASAVHAALARLAQMTADPERARRAADEASRLDSVRLTMIDPVLSQMSRLGVSSILMTTRAKEQEAEGNHAAAESLFRRVLAVRPEQPSAHVNLATHLLRTGRLPEAEPHYRQALELEPNNIPAMLSLAGLLGMSKRFDESRELFEQVLEMDPNNAEAFQGLGRHHINLGEHKQAETFFQRVVELRPESGVAHHDLAVALAFDGQTDLAWQHMRRAEELGHPVSALFRDAID